jgi:hypothetical protein
MNKRRPQTRCRLTLIHLIPTSSPFQDLNPRSSFSKNLIPESVVFELCPVSSFFPRELNHGGISSTSDRPLLVGGGRRPNKRRVQVGCCCMVVKAGWCCRMVVKWYDGTSRQEIASGNGCRCCVDGPCRSLGRLRAGSAAESEVGQGGDILDCNLLRSRGQHQVVGGLTRRRAP